MLAEQVSSKKGSGVMSRSRGQPDFKGNETDVESEPAVWGEGQM